MSLLRPLLRAGVMTLAAPLSLAGAACTVGSPVVTGTSTYSTQQDSVQGVSIPMSCSPADRPVLTFASPGGTFDPVARTFTGTLTAANGDRLQFSIKDTYGTTLDPLRSSFTFQVVYPQNQWGASSSSYSAALTVNVTF